MKTYKLNNKFNNFKMKTKILIINVFQIQKSLIRLFYYKIKIQLEIMNQNIEKLKHKMSLIMKDLLKLINKIIRNKFKIINKIHKKV